MCVCRERGGGGGEMVVVDEAAMTEKNDSTDKMPSPYAAVGLMHQSIGCMHVFACGRCAQLQYMLLVSVL